MKNDEKIIHLFEEVTDVIIQITSQRRVLIQLGRHYRPHTNKRKHLLLPDYPEDELGNPQKERLDKACSVCSTLQFTWANNNNNNNNNNINNAENRQQQQQKQQRISNLKPIHSCLVS